MTAAGCKVPGALRCVTYADWQVEFRWFAAPEGDRRGHSHQSRILAADRLV